MNFRHLLDESVVDRVFDLALFHQFRIQLLENTHLRLEQHLLLQFVLLRLRQRDLPIHYFQA